MGDIYLQTQLVTDRRLITEIMHSAELNNKQTDKHCASSIPNAKVIAHAISNWFDYTTTGIMLTSAKDSLTRQQFKKCTVACCFCLNTKRRYFLILQLWNTCFTCTWDCFVDRVLIVIDIQLVWLQSTWTCSLARYFQRPLNIFCEFIPQVVFLFCMFGYLIILIFYKWIHYDSSIAAPSLLIGQFLLFYCHFIDPRHRKSQLKLGNDDIVLYQSRIILWYFVSILIWIWEFFSS